MWLRKRLADRFILRPSRHVVDDPQPATRLIVDGPQGDIECFATRKPAGTQVAAPLDVDQPPADLLILKLPGTGGRAERSTAFPALLFQPRDVEVWTWNPPGYGLSQGSASLRHIPAAVLAVWDHLQQHRVGTNTDTNTLIVGNSLGSVTALYLASQRAADALMIRNPPPLVDMVRDGNAWWNAHRGGTWIAASIEAKMDATTTAGHCQLPALFVQSQLDALVPARLQQSIIDAYAGPHRLVVLPEAQHDTPYRPDDLDAIQSGLQWLMPELFAKALE
ncbi:alpha/beta hydrolase [Rosistilla oblonga]|uniref:alpha/beta hydrolase n=1 Tax=Rosistilla oblonga TaxID=2527990 RepID=UPI003A969448